MVQKNALVVIYRYVTSWQAHLTRLLQIHDDARGVCAGMTDLQALSSLATSSVDIQSVTLDTWTMSYEPAGWPSKKPAMSDA